MRLSDGEQRDEASASGIPGTRPGRWLRGVRRVLAAGSVSFVVVAGLLLYSVYKDRATGLTLVNLARCVTAGGFVALAVIGTRIRHAGMREG